MRIGIIGAGVAGLTTAKVLIQAGHDVVVHDRVSDVGGVWSAARRYPGLTTQSPKAQYSFSDFPMSKDLPEWPTGAQIQDYLAAYADAFGVSTHLRLDTDVVRASPLDDGRWELETRPSAGGPTAVERYDGVVVANGVFCEPAMPDLAGGAVFTAAGGRVLAGTQLHDADTARGRHVVVIGYGKSACDVAVPLSEVAASTHVVARQLLWKVPRKINGVVNFKMLLLTRMGEALFRYIRLHRVERFLHGPGNRIRRGMLNSIGSISVRQYGLQRAGLVPTGRMEDIVKGAIGLATEGFFEGVARGRIIVHRDQTVVELLDDAGQAAARLADGTVLPADLVVCSTGFTQSVPFLDESVQTSLFDDRGNFMLYRQIQPLGVPGLWFNGYNSSFFSPLNAEMAAVWIAADLAGALRLPDVTRRRAAVVEQLAFMDVAADRHHCRGTKIIPFSMHNVDEVLSDLGVNIPATVRASHWLNPVDPAAYRTITPQVLAGLPEPPVVHADAGPTTTDTAA